MSETDHTCPDCGAPGQDTTTCEEHFHQMLYWEWENPENLVVHHLMVLCYHLQHPHKYSVEGLRGSLGLLDDFVAKGITPGQVVQRDRAKVDSGKRKHTITSRPDSRGAYANPVAWTMTAASVTSAGAEHYIDSVRAWAQSAHDSLTQAGILG